jgi:exo-beta-1,3-glucanase (GH17 family)
MQRPNSLRHVLAFCALLSTACGDSTTPDDKQQDQSVTEIPESERRALPKEALSRKAVCYSGYRKDQSPDIQVFPSEDQIREDLTILKRANLTFLRLFDSGTHAHRVLSVIAKDKLDFKVMLGVWIAGSKAEHDSENQAEIERATMLANKYADVVVALSVGNETLDDWSGVKTSPADLSAYMLAVRKRVKQPITTDDSWLPFMLEKDGDTDYKDVINVAKVSDFLSLHAYAFSDAYYDGWDYKLEDVPEPMRAQAMMDAAFAYTKEAIQGVRETLEKKGVSLPIVIGEAGWKDRTPYKPGSDSDEDAIEYYFANPINQKIFFDDLEAWVYGEGKDSESPIAAFYFEAFDEPWKGEWGDDGWGLFDVDRKAKYLMWDALPDMKPADAKAPEPDSAAYYKPPASK